MSELQNLSFAVVIESANLSMAGLQSLWKCLNSLAEQELPIQNAKEVALMVAGELPAGTREKLHETFPWLTIQQLKEGTDYTRMKVFGAQAVTSDIVVFCDSDCWYEPGWLKHLLQSFQEREDIQLVAGETSTLISGPYSLAIALTYVFPRFSGETQLAPSAIYWANNVAIRRSLLSALPLPVHLPLFLRSS